MKKAWVYDCGFLSFMHLSDMELGFEEHGKVAFPGV